MADICTGITTSTGNNWITSNGLCLNWMILLIIVVAFLLIGMFAEFYFYEKRQEKINEGK